VKKLISFLSLMMMQKKKKNVYSDIPISVSKEAIAIDQSKETRNLYNDFTCQ
jgi:hypothetical protein